MEIEKRTPDDHHISQLVQSRQLADGVEKETKVGLWLTSGAAGPSSDGCIGLVGFIGFHETIRLARSANKLDMLWTRLIEQNLLAGTCRTSDDNGLGEIKPKLVGQFR